jgi:hypothetical protein
LAQGGGWEDAQSSKDRNKAAGEGDVYHGGMRSYVDEEACAFVCVNLMVDGLILLN